MKNWPLRWKIALYAAGLGVVATIAGASTTWLVMRWCETAALDRHLAAEGNVIYRLLEQTPANQSSTEIARSISQFTTSDRLLQVNDGPKLLYRSPQLQADLNGPHERPQKRSLLGRTYRIATFHRGHYRIAIAADPYLIDRLGIDIVLGMGAAIPTVLIVVCLGGRWIARQALGPVQAIREAASRITIDNLSQRLPVSQAGDEIAGLVTVLNHTFDRLQSSFEQSVRFCADASHQLKTPMAVLRAGIEEILTDSATPAKQQARAGALLHQVHQLTSVTENLLLLARADAGRLVLQPSSFNLTEVLDGMCDDTRALAEPNGLTVNTDVAPQLPVLADRAATALITQNLVENAVKFNQPGGVIKIKARQVDGHVEVTIANNGDVIPPERQQSIFDRFYRSKSDSRLPGHGLGLSIARELARAQGGEVALLKSDGDWTQFSLRLPAAHRA
jgi:signal transduction histidine kinase